MVVIFVTCDLSYFEANLSCYLAAGSETQCSLYKTESCVLETTATRGHPTCHVRQQAEHAQSGNK